MNAARMFCPYGGSAVVSLLFWVAVALGMVGCGGREEVPLQQLGGPAEKEPVGKLASAEPQETQQTTVPRKRRPGDGQSVESLWDRAARDTGDASLAPENPPSQVQFVKPEHLKAAGLRTVRGKHLLLVTDLQAAVNSLPQAFDDTISESITYLDLDPADWRDWQMTCYLMKDKDRFRSVGLVPADLPAFETSFALGNEFWINDRSDDYYRSRLMLMEGVRGLILTAYGTGGPAWLTAGLIEFLTTRRLHDKQLTTSGGQDHKVDLRLAQRALFIRDECAAGHALRLPQIMALNEPAQIRDKRYVWCWAVCAFLDGHPRYRDRFHTLCSRWSGPQFSRQFQEAFAEDWPELQEEWQVFVTGIDGGYDYERAAIEYGAGEAIPEKGRFVGIAADRGWQSSRVQLRAGVPYSVRARGRYQVATDPQQRVWWCEPGGVTIRYHQGLPLGILLGAVRPDVPNDRSVTPLVRPVVLGLSGRLQPDVSGTLYLRINDSYAELADNHGQLEVFIGPD
jgi:hypothetical protein